MNKPFPGAKVSFVGAGPGDPELITLKGKRLLEEADIIVYTGHLAEPVARRFARKDAELRDSAKMEPARIGKLLADACRAGRKAVRLATGDPSVFLRFKEIADVLKSEGIAFKVVPGVSSFLAAAASLRTEFVVPDVTRTVIMTYLHGRTPPHPKEKLEELAKCESSLVIFVGEALDPSLQERLSGAYPPETPVAVVYKASWPDERVHTGELKDLSRILRQEITVKNLPTNKTLIFVGQFLAGRHGAL